MPCGGHPGAPPSRGTRMRRTLRLTVALLAALTLAAGTPAAAHPAGPQWKRPDLRVRARRQPAQGLHAVRRRLPDLPVQHGVVLPAAARRHDRTAAVPLGRPRERSSTPSPAAATRPSSGSTSTTRASPPASRSTCSTGPRHPPVYNDFGNNGVSVSPDYSDPRLVTALEAFITALGRRYDGDPRIGFITLGLIGFWGEWHTWPYDGWTQPENWMPGTESSPAS